MPPSRESIESDDYGVIGIARDDTQAPFSEGPCHVTFVLEHSERARRIRESAGGLQHRSGGPQQLPLVICGDSDEVHGMIMRP